MGIIPKGHLAIFYHFLQRAIGSPHQGVSVDCLETVQTGCFV